MNYLKFYNTNIGRKKLQSGGFVSKITPEMQLNMSLSEYMRLKALEHLEHGTLEGTVPTNSIPKSALPVMPSDEEIDADIEAANTQLIQDNLNDTKTAEKLNLAIESANVSESERAAAELRALNKQAISTKSSISKGLPKFSMSTSQGVGMATNIGVLALNAVDELTMGDKNFGAQSQAIDSAVHGASSALLKSGNPYAMAAGAALEVANFMTKAGGKTVDGYDVDIKSSGYGTLAHKDSSSSRDFGMFLGLGGLNQGKMDAKLRKRNELAQMAMKAANVADTIQFEQEARMNSVDDTIEQNQIALAGGIDTSLLAARKGAKLERIKRQTKYLHPDPELIIIHENVIIDSPEEVIIDSQEHEIVKAQNGAKLEHIEVSEEPSVIPSGAMHKNKNHIDLDITKKGIPVITVEDDSAETFEDIKEQENTLIQHAEVEEAEIIFNKELTIFLENLRKQWHESDKQDDSICLEAGMRLAKEIVTNTEDNTDVTEKSIKAIENEDN